MRAAVNLLQERYRLNSMFLWREMEGVLSEGILALGEGDYRTKVMEQNDETRHLLLNKALELHPDQNVRPVWSWPELDKCSSQYLACLPHSQTSFTSAEFSEGVAAHLCVPSPACSTRMGEVVLGRQVVDKFGDEVISAKLCGDGWRTRHTQMEKLIIKKCAWAGVPIQSEVFHLFSQVIPQRGLSRIERGRKRNGIVPDFKFPGWGAGEETFLAELKGISSNKSRYPRNPRPATRAVDRRAAGLTAEYERKARKCDTEYCGTVPGQVGPVLAKLQSYGEVTGFCFGKWGEVSKEIHSLIHQLAGARLLLPGLVKPMGKKGKKMEDSAILAEFVSSLRREFSCTGVRAQSRLLLDRLDLLAGEGAGEGARRRRAAAAAEGAAAAERSAQRVAMLESREVVRRGRFMGR